MLKAIHHKFIDWLSGIWPGLKTKAIALSMAVLGFVLTVYDVAASAGIDLPGFLPSQARGPGALLLALGVYYARKATEKEKA